MTKAIKRLEDIESLLNAVENGTVNADHLCPLHLTKEMYNVHEKSANKLEKSAFLIKKIYFLFLIISSRPNRIALNNEHDKSDNVSLTNDKRLIEIRMRTSIYKSYNSFNKSNGCS